MRNPLNTSQGKGDAERHDRKKYGNGFDQINWGKKVDKAFRSKKKVKPLTPSKFNDLVNKLRKK